MKFTIHDVPQRSDAWRLLRAGRLTGSRASDILATLKSGGEPAARRDLRVQLVCERLIGRPLDNGFINEDMQRGIDLEPAALHCYEAKTGETLRTAGFFACDELMAGASPDGYVGNVEGICEVKVPRPGNHLRYLRSVDFPSEHRAQAIHALFVTGAKWVDLASFGPDFPEPLQLKIFRLQRDEKELAAYHLAASLFLSEVDRELAEIQRMMEAA